MSDIRPIRLKGREVKPQKSISSPELGSRTVLTNSPWEFVSLWLREHKAKKALFYWNQAFQFNNASLGLPTQSAPLLHYYSFLNGVKALLSSKNISFKEHHGIKKNMEQNQTSRISISNESVKILQEGVLPSLSLYLGEKETSKVHTLQELLERLPHIFF